MKIEYNNLYTHFVFTTLNRMPIIPENNRQRIEKYITGIIKNNAGRLYAIYANPDHVHFLVSHAPGMADETLATIIADSSERFINENKLSVGFFQWQQTCSAFSVSKEDVDRVCKYILNQKEHHTTKSYDEEYGHCSMKVVIISSHGGTESQRGVKQGRFFSVSLCLCVKQKQQLIYLLKV